MTTPLDIITVALKDSGVLGVGNTPAAEDTNDAFLKLNRMLAQFSLRRWLVFQIVDTAFIANGATAYTVGPNCNFNIPRPDRLEGAYVRQTNAGQAVDWPVKIIEAHEDYANIVLKTLQTLPNRVFYDSGFPTGNVYFYPVPPTSMYEAHILTKSPLAAFSSLTQSINLPPEYEEALIYNLAVRLRPAYQMPPDPTITQLAKASLNTIKNANTQMPRLKMPSELVGRGSYWDPYSDQVR